MFNENQGDKFPMFCDDCRIKFAKILSIEQCDYYKALDESWTVIAAFPEFTETQRLSKINCKVERNFYDVTVRFDDSVSNSVIDMILYNMSAVDFRKIVEDTVSDYLENLRRK